MFTLIEQVVVVLDRGGDPWEELGVATPECPFEEPFCTTCELGNWELEMAIEGGGDLT